MTAHPPIVVLLGGPSAEHDVSVVSGTAIAEALADVGYPVSAWLIDLEGGWWWLPDGHRRAGRPQVAYDDPAALGATGPNLPGNRDTELAAAAAPQPFPALNLDPLAAVDNPDYYKALGAATNVPANIQKLLQQLGPS